MQNTRIEGTESYIVGDYTADGHRVDTHRETTVEDLFAMGDVAGGCPQKYVMGTFVEGEIATRAAAKYQQDAILLPAPGMVRAKQRWLGGFLSRLGALHSMDGLEEAMQAVMDEYADGIGVHYCFSDQSLHVVDGQIWGLQRQAELLSASELQGLVYILELLERLTLYRSVIVHLGAQKETCRHSFAEHTDYPKSSARWDYYVNSRLGDGGLSILFRPLVKEGETYEH